MLQLRKVLTYVYYVGRSFIHTKIEIFPGLNNLKQCDVMTKICFCSDDSGNKIKETTFKWNTMKQARDFSCKGE